MRLVSKIIGNNTDLADGALDTLGSVIRVMGDESFPLDQDLKSVQTVSRNAMDPNQ